MAAGKLRKPRYGKYRKLRGRKTRLRLQKSLLGFPNSMRRTLKYVENITIDCPIGGGTSYLYRANSLYDPNQTGSGHQPKYFDIFMSIYDHYTVMGSRITVKYLPSIASNNIPGVFALFTTDDTGQTFVDSSDLLESKYATKSKVYNLLEALGNGGQPSLKAYFNTKKFFRVVNVRDREDLQGTSASNPTEEAFYYIYVGAISGSDPSNAAFEVSIEYDAVFTELKDIGQS